jgi:hypothetical protein
MTVSTPLFVSLPKNAQLNISALKNSASWEYNLNYWTSARRIFKNNTFEYCHSNASSPLMATDKYWGHNEPDNKNGSQDCVHLKINKTAKVAQLTDRGCKDGYVFACQVPPNTL